MKSTAMTAIPILPTRAQRKLAPCHDWLFVQPEAEMGQTPSGIWTPAVPDGKQAPEAIVRAVGPACPSGVKIGDHIRFVGMAPDFVADGETFHMVRDAMPVPGDIMQNQRGEPIGCAYLICIIRAEEALQ